MDLFLTNPFSRFSQRSRFPIPELDQAFLNNLLILENLRLDSKGRCPKILYIQF